MTVFAEILLAALVIAFILLPFFRREPVVGDDGDIDEEIEKRVRQLRHSRDRSLPRQPDD
jgi:hypothetical protein